MPALFRARPWHLPGVLAAVLATVLGTVSAVAVLGRPAAAADGPGTGPKVTLSATADLVNQRILVRWSGFMANSYALGIYQCKGPRPTALGCDGVNVQESNPDRGDRPPGTIHGHGAQYGLTGSAGEAWFRILPKEDRSFLGCDDVAPCGVAVVLRPTVASTAEDFTPANVGFSVAAGNVPTDREFSVAVAAGQAAYAPISFAAASATCPDNRTALRLAGNAEHSMAGQSWTGRLCRQARPLTATVAATSSPEGRAAFREGLVDAAVTTQPIGGPIDQALSEQPTTLPGRGAGEAVYAPLTNGALVFAMNIERMDPGMTGYTAIEPVNLTPRLAAKLLTNAYSTSARHMSGSRPTVPVSTAPGVPPTYRMVTSLYEDPEFLAANPGRVWPDLPLHALTLRGASDDTLHELTRWLVSDPESRAWLSGTVDEGGLSCPDVWRIGAAAYPSSLIVNRLEESYLTYRPVSSYWSIVDNLVRSQGPGVTSDTQKPIDADQSGRHRVLAVTSFEAARRMQLPVANLRNAAGVFVAPTAESITAGVKAAKPGPDGVTLSNDFATADPKAYPLTTTDVAALPTKNVSKDLAAAVDTYLGYVAGPGQTPGLRSGELPPGYAPLTDKQRQQAANARDAVQRAANTPPATTPPPGTTGSGTGGGQGTGSGSTGTTSGSGGTSAGGTVAGGGTASAGGSSATPSARPSASATPRPEARPAAAAPKPDTLPAAVAERLRDALDGDPAAILLAVLMGVALASGAASPVLLGIGWHRRTGRWPPPLPALARAVRRNRPAGGAR
ncbi:substrate-binding domain-containing protein [Yinghuangia soli]|uniref:Substrate-binding domain-containing protein n=1 Tax=Yinghuangia soli TaxID=2908204 RepID=A0AA41Q206_9ACTN|nr:substrate-binding domain-containing protein [Yinghuangia soli]MCF2528984.1 substrate-binding domain-containing protein [Yinghuangia soli]